MNRCLTGLAVAAVAALLALTGSAVAGGNGNGNNGNGNGNQPAAQAPAPAAAPAAPANSANAPGQQKKSSSTNAPTQSSHAPGQAKKSSSTSSTAPGVKPSNTTAAKYGKPSHTTVGASPDVSKRYGNAKTAAQIAKSRGAPDKTELTGPGNSQPHKVAVCPKKSNKSGGVDVHAIKSYSATCTQTQQHAAPHQTTQTAQPCVATTTIVTRTHGHETKEERGHAFGEERKENQQSKATSKSIVVVRPATCASSHSSLQSSQATQRQVPFAAAVGASSATQSSSPSTASQQQSAGGVLGAQATLKRSAAPKAKPAGGVLGTVGHVAGTTLPFTGLQLWIAVLIAAGLILVGSVLYRRGRGASDAL